HKLLPNYTYVETNLGIVKAALHRDAEAEPHFKRAMTLSRVPVAHQYYARFLRERGRHDDARQVLEMGLRMQPDQWDITISLLSVLDDTHKYGALKAALNDAKQRFPYRPELNRFMTDLSRVDARLKELEARSPQDLATLNELFRLRLDLGQTDAAI